MENLAQTPKHSASFISLFIAFILGFGGLLGYRYVSSPKQVLSPTNTTSNPASSVPEPTFVLAPPSQAVSGILTITKGKADIFTRTADAYAEATSGGTILVGESLATKEYSSASVVINNALEVLMDETSEVSFANLYMDDMVLLQKAGTVTYKITNGMKPVSVRVLHNLIALETGEMTVTIDDTNVILSVFSGGAKLAQVDTDNTTHVWNIKEKERALIDDEERLVRVLKLR